MSEPVVLGIVGLGAMGSELLDVAAEHPDIAGLFCADVQAESISSASSKHPQVSFTTSPYDVIDSDNIDAVYIATPPIFHADYAIRAMRQGKHIFCEKPLAISLADGEAMVSVAAETGLVNAVNFALADRHAALEIERALKAGEIGDIRGVEVRLSFPEWPRAFQSRAVWLGKRVQGGFIREVFSHFAYLTDRLLGPITSAFTKADFVSNDPEASETAAVGSFTAGEVPIRFNGYTGVAVPETYEWSLYGSRRSYCLRNWSELLVSDGSDWRNVVLLGERGSEKTRLSSFVKAIRKEAKSELPDFAAALRVQKLVESFHQAAAS